MRTMARYLPATLLAIVMPACADAQMIIRQAVVDIDVHADGSAVQTAHVALRATNDAAAQRIAQHPIDFSASREELTILEAYTQKPDGTRLPVDAGAIHAQLVPGSPNLTLFNDQERKVIVFPSAAAQDTFVYTVPAGGAQAAVPGPVHLADPAGSLDELAGLPADNHCPCDDAAAHRGARDRGRAPAGRRSGRLSVPCRISRSAGRRAGRRGSVPAPAARLRFEHAGLCRDGAGICCASAAERGGHPRDPAACRPAHRGHCRSQGPGACHLRLGQHAYSLRRRLAGPRCDRAACRVRRP